MITFMNHCHSILKETLETAMKNAAFHLGYIFGSWTHLWQVFANKVLEKCLDVCTHVGLPVSLVPALTRKVFCANAQKITLQKWQLLYAYSEVFSASLQVVLIILFNLTSCAVSALRRSWRHPCGTDRQDAESETFSSGDRGVGQIGCSHVMIQRDPQPLGRQKLL